MKVYFDSSFLVSLYSPDANSTAAMATIQTSFGDRLLTTLAEIEVTNALELRIFRKEATSVQAHVSLSDFEKDLSGGLFQPRGLSEPIFERALQLSRQTTAKLGTRTADLLHVAAALEFGVDYLYSFDQSQRRLAQTVRLKVN